MESWACRAGSLADRVLAYRDWNLLGRVHYWLIRCAGEMMCSAVSRDTGVHAQDLRRRKRKGDVRREEGEETGEGEGGLH